jgi:ribosomal protein L7/L12
LDSARAVVDALARQTALRAVDEELQSEILSLVQGGKYIAAIKRYREATGVGLHDAKEAVDALAASRGIVVPGGSGCLSMIIITIATAGVISALVC